MTNKLLLVVCLLSSSTVFAVDDAQQASNKAQVDTQSGYETEAVLAGPDDVVSELVDNDEDRDSLFQPEVTSKVFGPYFDWKREISEKHDLNIGFSLYMLYQNSQHSANSETDAAGTIFRFQGSWKAFALSDGSTGSLIFRVENRSDFAGLQAPSTLGNNIAGALDSGFGYVGSFDTDLSVLSWKQTFNKNTAGFDIGRLAFDVYLDAFVFQTFSRGFLNRSLLLNPTMATTGIGALGAAVKGFVPNNITLGAQIYDANAKSGQWDSATIREGE